MANDINLPNLVSHLEVQLADTSGIIADAGRQGSSVGAALGDSLRSRLAAAVAGIPPVDITADPTPIDQDLTRVRHQLQELADTRIGVDITVEEALRRMEELEPHLDRLEHSHPSINVQAAVAGARADLEEIREVARHVDEDDVNIDVHVDTARPTSELSGLSRATTLLRSTLGGVGGAAASLGRVGALAGAAIPAVAGLVATLEQIGPAAAVGVSGALAVGSAFGAVKLGTSGIGDAITAAFAPVTGGGGGGGSAGAAAAATRAVADAQRNLKDVVQQTALSNQQAIRAVATAQRDLTDAQRAAKDAQLSLVAAQKEASRQLEDQNNQLIDAKNAEADAVFGVTDAQKNLDALTAAGSKATQEDRDKAALALAKAKQGLVEQSLQVKRLQADTDAANKAGVNGSQLVVDAQTKVAGAARDVSDRQRDVSDAQKDVARTAASGAEAIDKAREALQQAGEAASGGSSGGAAGGIDAFAAAMAKLSPSAQAFVREIIKLKPAFDSLKLDVQEHLLAGLAAELDTTAHALLPVFRRSLDDSATSLNGMAKGVAAAARDLADSGTLGTALQGANKGLSNLVPIPGQVVTALGEIGAAAAPAFDRLTKAAADGVKKIADKLDKAFTSGGLERAINTAVDLLGELLHVGGNVVKIIGNILEPAHATGGGLIGILSQITDALVKVSGEKGFQDALGALFSVMGEIGKVAGPLVVSALRDLEPVFKNLGGPAKNLVDALGQGLSPILDALGPLLDAASSALGGLSDAVAPLLPVLGDMLAKLGPALQPILDALAGSFDDLQPLVSEIATDLSDLLMPVLDRLPGLVQPLADMLQNQLSTGLKDLTNLLQDNRPEFEQLGKNLADIADALIPLLAQWAALDAELLTKAAPLIGAVAGAATRLAVVLTDQLSGTINNVVIPALKILTDLLHGRFGAAWDELRHHASGAISTIVALIGGLPALAARALGPLASKLGAKAVDAANRLTAPIGDGVNTAVEWVGKLPSRIGKALGDLGSYLYKSGRSLIGGFVSGMLSKLQDAKSAASSILGKVSDFFPHSPAKTGPFSGKGWTGYSGQSLVEDWGGGMLAGLPSLLRNVGAVVTGASGALAGVPSLAGAVPSAGALAASYAGTAAPAQGPTTINLFGTEATPGGVSDALSWRSKVGRH